MNIISGIYYHQVAEYYLAFLKVTTDADSERLQVIERATGKLIWHQRTDGGKTVKVILPIQYANDPLLTCILYDDSLANNAAIIDGVQCELIDASTFDMGAA